MPSSTERQARTMAAAAHSPAFAAKVGIPTKVATDFNRADTGTARLARAMRKRSTGGTTSGTAIGGGAAGGGAGS